MIILNGDPPFFLSIDPSLIRVNGTRYKIYIHICINIIIYKTDLMKIAAMLFYFMFSSYNLIIKNKLIHSQYIHRYINRLSITVEKRYKYYLMLPGYELLSLLTDCIPSSNIP